MKEITVKDKTYLFVEVPNNATEKFLCEWGKDCQSISFGIHEKEVHLPKGIYKIISTIKDITEEQAESIVEKKTTEGSDIFGCGYLYFIDYINNENTLIEEAKESLQSLMKSNGLSLEINYLILEKI